ncbi:MAG: copper resistance CopC family protein [Chloroflexota bacterium]
MQLSRSRDRGRGRGPSRRARAAGAGLLLLLLSAPSAVLAHAELISSTPADGAVLTEPPAEIVLTYSQGLDEGSSIVLKDASGTEIARGVPAAIGVKEMRATFAPLGAGSYTIESTTKSSEDGEIDRVTITFSVAVPAPPVPTPAATLSPTDEPSAAAPTPSPAQAASPTPGPTGGGAGGDATADYLIPIAIVGLLIGGGLAYFLRRRGPA